MGTDNSKKKTTSSTTTEPRKKSSIREKTAVNNEEKTANSSEKRSIEIEINKYKQLVDAINDPKKLAKVIVVITVVVVLIFLGISMVSLMLKKFYPYKAISTIQSGATIIENEDTEVIYWLFNSADLWSNSGIEVNEGDVITVRASGAFHTAIHHAVQDAESNSLFRDEWILPMGGRRQLENRDSERMKYRIMPHAPDNVLLMQIIPDKEANTGRDWLTNPDSTVMGFRDGGENTPIVSSIIKNILSDGGKNRYPDADIVRPYDVDIIIIGEEKRDIRIPHDGILHFAVNDIVLTERNIQNMMNSSKIQIGKINGEIRDTGRLELGRFPIPKTKNELKKIIDYINKTVYSIDIEQQRIGSESGSTTLEEDVVKLDAILKLWDDYSKKDSILQIVIMQNLSKRDYDSIVHSILNNNKIDKTSFKPGPFTIPPYKEVLDSIINHIKRVQNNKQQNLKLEQKVDNNGKHTIKQQLKRILKRRENNYIIRQQKMIIQQRVNIKQLEDISKNWDTYCDIHQELKDIINRNLTELDYYRMHNFVDAWFVDNVGSILIAIERKKK